MTFIFSLTWVNNKCIPDKYKEHETLGSILIESNYHTCYLLPNQSTVAKILHDVHVRFLH